jgi:hypothetical protein
MHFISTLTRIKTHACNRVRFNIPVNLLSEPPRLYTRDWIRGLIAEFPKQFSMVKTTLLKPTGCSVWGCLLMLTPGDQSQDKLILGDALIN